MKADHKLVAGPQGRGAKIAARAHHLLEDFLLPVLSRVQVRKRFSLGNGDFRRVPQYLPRRRAVHPHRAGVNHLANYYLFLLENLPGIVAGGSALTEIGPIDFHRIPRFLPWIDLVAALFLPEDPPKQQRMARQIRAQDKKYPPGALQFPPESGFIGGIILTLKK
ncbi:MAG: hypothetical protein WCZ86_02400 [Desulfurivibrionaceae bacterium]